MNYLHIGREAMLTQIIYHAMVQAHKLPMQYTMHFEFKLSTPTGNASTFPINTKKKTASSQQRELRYVDTSFDKEEKSRKRRRNLHQDDNLHGEKK